MKGGIFIPNLTTPVPPPASAEPEESIKALRAWGAALIDELTYMFANLDSGNVKSAASVKAENIDTSTARISNAQIGVLSADKLTAGTIDTNNVTVSSNDGQLKLTGKEIYIIDKNKNKLFYAGYNPETNVFDFKLYGKGGKGIYLNNEGNAVFSGILSGSEIYSSKIVGTSISEYIEPTYVHPFVQIDSAGITMQQTVPDKQSVRQKFGATISYDGSVIMALGEGEGEEAFRENGVIYRPGSFVIKKSTDDTAKLELYAKDSGIELKDGSLNLKAGSVKVNGKKVATSDDIKRLENLISSNTGSGE